MSNFLSKVKELSAEVATFRNMCIVLGAVAIIQAIVVLFLGFRPPLVIERSEGATVATAQVSNRKPTISEVKNFVHLALDERLSSAAASLNLLSDVERERRHSEQEELKKRDITQFVVVENVEVAQGKILAHVTRVLSVGKIRSAFPADLELNLEELQRTASNPYGLILVDTKSITKEGGVR